MKSLKVYPNAKVNLGLHIEGRRADGYHELQTIFLPAPLKDVLEIELLEDQAFPEIEIAGIYLQGNKQDNLCIRAWKYLQEVYPELPAIKIYLEKHIPAGAGLGGGSADAAFTLQAIPQLLGIHVEESVLAAIALKLGADVPFFLYNRPMLAKGIGEQLQPIDIELPGTLRLITPPVFSDTREAYQGLLYASCHAGTDLQACVRMTPENWRHVIFNDFEPSVFLKYPELAEAKQQLYMDGAVYASMSGSGSALYGFFKDLSSDKTIVT